MKPNNPKNRTGNKTELVEYDNYDQRLSAEDDITDILDTDEDKVMGYYMNMSFSQERNLMHA